MKNHFWKDVFKAWSCFCSCHQPSTRNEIIKSSVWFNDRIKVNKQTLYYHHWVRNGVDLVNDLLDERGNFLSLAGFKNKYGIRTNFLEYGGVISSIKKSFPNTFNNPGDTLVYPTIPFNLNVLFKDKKGSRRIYAILVSKKEVNKNYVHKWENKLNISYAPPKWSSICNSPFRCTISTKLRWFQYRLVHRILGTNLFLLRIGKKDSNMCTFCHEAEETLIHIFCNCRLVIEFWDDVMKWIKEKADITTNWGKENLLFGVNENIIDLILLLCRFHIYKMKMNDKKPSIHILKKDIKNYYDMEKYTYACNSNIGNFFKRWGIFNMLCT